MLHLGIFYLGSWFGGITRAMTKKKLSIPKGFELCPGCKGIGCKRCNGKGYRTVVERQDGKKEV